MKLFHKLAALCAAFLISLCFFCTVAYAVEEPEPHTPAIAATQSAVPTEIPTENEAEPMPAIAEEEPTTDVVPPSGTGTVIETATSADREFYTISTPAGNVFYLIIDTTRPAENVYFLDAVTEKDLLALAEKTDDKKPDESPIGGIISDEKVDTAPTPQPSPEAQDAQSGNMSNIIIIVVMVLGIGGVAYYFKVYRKKKNADIHDEYEADEPETAYEEYAEED